MNDFNERSTGLPAADESARQPDYRGPIRAEGSPPGKRNEEGPPDLDEMWRDFNLRLARLLGGKRGGPGQPPDQRRAAQLGIGIVIGVLLAAYVGSGLFVVPTGQTGVVQQLGRYSGTVGEGVHWHVPYPFASAQVVDTSQAFTLDVSQYDSAPPNATVNAVLTRDGDIVDVRMSVQYRISSATDYLFHVTDPDGLVEVAARAALRSAIGAQHTDAVFAIDRAALRSQLMSAVQGMLDRDGAGLTVTGVSVSGIDLPAQVQTAAAQVSAAQQQADADKRSAQAYADALLPPARAEAAKLADAARMYAQQEVGQAQGDADRFKQVYAQYQKAPAVVRERLYLDTMQQIYSTATKVYVGNKSGSNVLYLPLDKLVQATRDRAAGDMPASAAGAQGADSAGASAAAAADTASDTGGTPAAQADSAAASGSDTTADQPGSDPIRSRDALRSRDREDPFQ